MFRRSLVVISTLKLLCQVSKRLTMLGYDSYKVPEAATLLINGGIDWAAISTEAQLLEAQRQLLRTQVSHCNELV